jgi:hypothetical protein
MIDAARSGMVGRTEALRRLSTVLERAEGGVGGVALVFGEAGIGKTALSDAALEAARRQGWNTAWVAASSMSTVPGLWPWRRVLAALGGDLPPPPAGEADPGAARVAQFDAIVERVATAAQEAPVLAVLDDAHWADPATLAMVLHFAAACRSVRGALVVTFRPEDAGPGTPLGAVLPRLRRLSTEIELTGLGRDDVAALAAEVAGGVPMSDAAVDELFEASGGNPLFVCEVVRSFGGRPPVPLGQRPVPPAITTVVSEWIGRLSPGCREALALASAMGADIDVAAVARAAGAEPADMLSLLDEAVAAAVLVERDDGRFDFRHPLFCAAVYDGLGTAGRAGAHARIAGALEAAAADGATVEAAALAHHFGRSAPLGNAGKAVRYAVAAGDEAMAALAYETASRRYTQALAALDLDPGAGDRVAILLARADADAACGRHGDAAAGYEAAADLAARGGRAGDLARAALGRSGGAGMEVAADATARAVLDRAVARVGDDQPALRARLLARLSIVLAPTAAATDRERLLDEAGSLAAACGDPLAVADVAVARCHLHAGPGAIALRLGEAAAIVREAAAVGQVRLELLGRRLRVEALLEAGRFADARDEVAAYEARARLVRDPSYDHFGPLWRATLAAACGDEDGYRRERAVLRDLVANLPADSDGRVLAAVQELFHCIDRAGDPAGARAAFESLVGSLRAGLPAQVAVTDALVRAVEGHLDEARAELAEWQADIRAVPEDAEWLPAMVQLADTAALTGRHALVDWARGRLEPHAAVWAVEGIGAAVRGPAARALAVLARAAGDDAAAERWGALAQQLAARAGVSAWAAEGPPRDRGARLVKDGDGWVVDFDGVSARVRDSKGMRDIAELLARPGRAIAALDLVAAGSPTVAQPGSGPALDATARAQYRRRLAELEEALDDADRTGDVAASARLAAERDMLAAELAGAYGLGGRARQAGSSGERARTAVTTRVKDALRRLDQVHPAAARHLRRAIRTGTFCVYDPDPPLVWQVRVTTS